MLIIGFYVIHTTISNTRYGRYIPAFSQKNLLSLLGCYHIQIKYIIIRVCLKARPIELSVFDTFL